MPLPSLSLVARRKLITEALDDLDPEAQQPRFRDQEQRLGSLYHSGLRDLLEQPRDVVRVFNAFKMMEPLLRGEIVFADILGLVALSVKAPAVFELLRKSPRFFVGLTADDFRVSDKTEDVIKSAEQERRIAYEASGSASAVQRVVHFLFPGVAEAEGSLSLGKGSYAEGNISHPAKLAIALQLCLTDGDVSIKAARRYLQCPNERDSVEALLTNDNCEEFVELLGDVGKSLCGEGIADMDETCLSIARLVEKPLFVTRAKERTTLLRARIEDAALQTVDMLIRTMEKKRAAAISERIAIDAIALSCAAEIVTRSYVPGREVHSQQLTLPIENKDKVLQIFARNVLDAANRGLLFETNHAGYILWTMARVVPHTCPSLYKVLKDADVTLDQFALHYLGSSWDLNGVVYSKPRDKNLHGVYCPEEEFQAHAEARLKDENLRNPARTAWQSVVEDKALYGSDGSEAHR